LHTAVELQQQKSTVKNPNTEGVRQFQPRVELWQPWDKSPIVPKTLKGFTNAANPFRVKRSVLTVSIPGLPKPNPGLELANTFGVKIGQENKKSAVCFTDFFLRDSVTLLAKTGPFLHL
jgi:hypothetical protein